MSGIGPESTRTKYHRGTSDRAEHGNPRLRPGPGERGWVFMNVDTTSRSRPGAHRYVNTRKKKKTPV